MNADSAVSSSRNPYTSTGSGTRVNQRGGLTSPTVGVESSRGGGAVVAMLRLRLVAAVLVDAERTVVQRKAVRDSRPVRKRGQHVRVPVLSGLEDDVRCGPRV